MAELRNRKFGPVDLYISNRKCRGSEGCENRQRDRRHSHRPRMSYFTNPLEYRRKVNLAATFA